MYYVFQYSSLGYDRLPDHENEEEQVLIPQPESPEVDPVQDTTIPLTVEDNQV
jgi:hypothetical protein